MKKILLVILGGFFLCNTNAQDVIYKNDGTEIKSFVKEITTDEIKFTNFNQPDGPLRNVPIKEVFMIIYKDGSKEVFKGKYEDGNLPSESQNSQDMKSSDQNIQDIGNANFSHESSLPIISTNTTTGESRLKDPRDGKSYKLIKVGEQVWMAENLKATEFNDGTPIPLVQESNEWKRLTTPGYCYEFGYLDINGAFYNFYSVETEKLCPLKWHVAKDEDWQKLFDSFGGKGVAGRQMKEVKGFNAILAGYHSLGSYHDLDYIGSWWSATDGHFFFIMKPYKGVFDKSLGAKKSDGRSVRCVMD